MLVGILKTPGNTGLQAIAIKKNPTNPIKSFSFKDKCLLLLVVAIV